MVEVHRRFGGTYWLHFQDPRYGLIYAHCFLSISSTLKMREVRSSETSAKIYRTTRHHITENSTHHSHCCESLKSNKLFKNKKFWVELIAYFSWYDIGHTENGSSNNTSVVACVLVTAVTFLPTRCLATIRGFLPRHCLVTLRGFLPSRCLATMRGIHTRIHK
jgi:hypothetical protein